MGTALVMEHANALAQMIVSEKDKLFDERVEALVKLYRRAEFYLKQGFLESIVCEFHRKKVEMIMQAETKGEITEILKLSKPHFDGKKFVYTSPYAVEEEELLLWSLPHKFSEYYSSGLIMGMCIFKKGNRETKLKSFN